MLYQLGSSVRFVRESVPTLDKLYECDFVETDAESRGEWRAGSRAESRVASRVLPREESRAQSREGSSEDLHRVEVYETVYGSYYAAGDWIVYFDLSNTEHIIHKCDVLSLSSAHKIADEIQPSWESMGGLRYEANFVETELRFKLSDKSRSVHGSRAWSTVGASEYKTYSVDLYQKSKRDRYLTYRVLNRSTVETKISPRDKELYALYSE
ncbi:hypothetical protein DFJ73DRAFT_797139 [Zopfochytrium polystomum]|nr:hypothetical protein DFJ73DRAFT_797139 [Zopfochytrium polystomum]